VAGCRLGLREGKTDVDERRKRATSPINVHADSAVSPLGSGLSSPPVIWTA
jgi:hypothetical protein